MLVQVKDILTQAKKGGYAVGAFNTVNMETTQAIIEAASEMKSPVIVQITEKTMDYAGGRGIFNIVKNIAEFYGADVPIGIHLDHGKSFEVVERALEIGFTSVMYDGSRKKYEDNLAMTKKVVESCHKKGIDVQAELGNVPYMGESPVEINWDDYMTDPEQAKSFVKETGVDALAVAIGNAHNFAKEREVPDYDRLSKISEGVSVPLIMHGASDWEEDKVKESVKRGIACFNVDTALRMAFLNDMINRINKGEITFDIRKSLGNARSAAKEVVKGKIEIFGSKNKA